MSANAAPSAGFRVSTVRREKTTVVKCSGRLTSQVTSVLKDEVKPLLSAPGVVVLDFTEVNHLDSSGLGAVVSLYVTARKENCDLRLVNFSKRVRELLGMTNLLSVFEDCGQYGVRML